LTGERNKVDWRTFECQRPAHPETSDVQQFVDERGHPGRGRFDRAYRGVEPFRRHLAGACLRPFDHLDTAANRGQRVLEVVRGGGQKVITRLNLLTFTLVVADVGQRYGDRGRKCRQQLHIIRTPLARSWAVDLDCAELLILRNDGRDRHGAHRTTANEPRQYNLVVALDVMHHHRHLVIDCPPGQTRVARQTTPHLAWCKATRCNPAKVRVGLLEQVESNDRDVEQIRDSVDYTLEKSRHLRVATDLHRELLQPA